MRERARCRSLCIGVLERSKQFRRWQDGGAESMWLEYAWVTDRVLGRRRGIEK
jgi:hypothetical protein